MHKHLIFLITTFIGLAGITSQTCVADTLGLGIYNTDGHGLYSASRVTPLISFNLTASVEPRNNETLRLSASYRRVEFNWHSNQLGYRETRKDFRINTYHLKNRVDFSELFKQQPTVNTLQKLADKLIVNGAIGFQVPWN